MLPGEETTTMEAPVEDKLFRFITDCWQNQYSLEILLFLGKHPSTRFNCPAIAQASATPGADVQRALNNLIDRGLVAIYCDNGTRLYSLTKNKPLRSLVLRMVAINQHHLQLTLRQIRQRYKPLARAVLSVSGST